MQWQSKRLDIQESIGEKRASHQARKRGEDMKITEQVDMSRSEWEHLIDEWIFNERDRKLLKRRLLDGICYEPLAYEFDMSTTQIKSIIYKLQKKLFKHL